VITSDEARVLANHRALVAKVIRVDDFDADLGTSLLRQAEGSRAPAAAVRDAQRVVA
jgi:hypothetical protein